MKFFINAGSTRVLGIVIIIAVLFLLGLTLISFSQKGLEKIKVENMLSEKPLEGKKILYLIAFRNFRDEEYFVPKNLLEKAGALVVTASSSKGEAVGSQEGKAKVDITLDEVNDKEFQAIILAGGQGALEYLDNNKVYDLVRTIDKEKKLVAAICISPTILAKAGILQGKRATVWSSPLEKRPIEILEKNGAQYIDKAVVVDDNIITANGPQAAEKFAQAIIKFLTPKGR